MERDNGSWYARWRASAFQLTRSRGAWRLSILAWQVSANFNSHAHVERDKDNVILTSDKQISTHTLTWSVTPARFMRLRSSTFQLTRSRGAWLVISLWHMTTLIFQLTRSRGAWHNEKRHCHSWLIFQLTRSRGAWLKHMDRFGLVSLFQLTRSRGAWRQG